MKKKLNVFLIVFVLGLWGTVAYKYVKRFLMPTEIAQTAAPKMYSAEIKAKDTFAMETIGRDPFLNSASAPVVKRVVRYSGPRVVKKEPPVFKPTVPFPKVDYFGFIKAHQKEVALLKVNSKLVRLSAGELSDGLKVVKIYKDSVQLGFGKETRSVKRGASAATGVAKK